MVGGEKIFGRQCINIPWSQLTSFRSDSLCLVTEILPILRSCRNLESLYLEVYIDEPDFNEGDGFVLQLDNLTSMTVEVDYSDWPLIFFQKMKCMRLPALKTLNIACSFKESWVEAFISALSHSGCCGSLTRFGITGCLGDGRLKEILAVLPHLKDLSVSTRGWYNHIGEYGIPFGPLVMQGLGLHGSSPSSSTLVPHLLCLELSLGDDRFDYNEFAIMVASRWNPAAKGSQMAGEQEVVACLESVRLLTNSSFDKDTDAYRRLQNMKAQGLDLTIGRRWP
ncbi:hypothetical protein VKT23_010676 [Stygiomarasmius scandens]|uniref:FBD domain-containing protein n=1 Tax=Marasmiellus scandens TaxID=2682957 RepID=A0ABR1JDL8_9AGAR